MQSVQFGSAGGTEGAGRRKCICFCIAYTGAHFDLYALVVRVDSRLTPNVPDQGSFFESAEPGDLIVHGCGCPELHGVYKRSFPVSSTRILLEGAKGAAAEVNGEYHLCNGTKNGRKNYIKDGVLLATSLSNIN